MCAIAVPNPFPAPKSSLLRSSDLHFVEELERVSVALGTPIRCRLKTERPKDRIKNRTENRDKEPRPVPLPWAGSQFQGEAIWDLKLPTRAPQMPISRSASTS